MNMTQKMTAAVLAAALSVTMIGCEGWGPKTTGTAVGGAAGAGLGAIIGGDDNRLLGALIGGAVGAGGGYLVGANWDKISGDDKEEAQEAIREAQQNPATPADVRGAMTADLNQDGFVTMDEVIAMENAGLSDEEIVRRLDATNQIFELNNEQERFLVNQGVSYYVIREMRTLNADERERLLQARRTDVLGQPAAQD